MRSFKIFQLAIGTILYTLNERTGYYESEEDQLGELDFILENNVTIKKVKRTRNTTNIELFSINDRVKIGNGRTIHSIILFNIVGNKIVVSVKQESNQEVKEVSLDDLVPYTEPVRTTTTTTRTQPNNTLETLERTILSNYPRAIRLERLLKTRPANETLKDFLIKFFSGKGEMEEGFNDSRNTIYADDNSVQTGIGKRRSLGDIFMICRYYYPNCTLKDVLRILYIELPAHYESGFRSNNCRQIHKRVWYYSSGNGNIYMQADENDEYGNNKSRYLELIR